MIPLPKIINGRGPQAPFTFTQKLRQGNVALLEKTHPTHSRITWEVVKIQKNKERTIRGITYPAAEGLPSQESWGHKGWSFLDEEKARKKFMELVK